jgi:hypothetical protein
VCSERLGWRVNSIITTINAVLAAMSEPMLRHTLLALRAMLRGDHDAAARHATRAAKEQASARVRDEMLKRTLKAGSGKQ